MLFLFSFQGNALAKNREQRATNFVNAQNLSILSREVQNAHEEKTMEINSALTRMTLQEQSMLKSNRLNLVFPS